LAEKQNGLDGRRNRFISKGDWAIIRIMEKYRYTDYFENEVMRKRPYLRKEWCVRVLENPIRVEPQEHNRYRFWGTIDELV